MKEKDILVVLIAAISIFILLAGGIVAFVALYSKRVRQHQALLLEHERKEQLNLLNATINAQEAERQRIGADIHDDIGPMLASSKLLINKFLHLNDKSQVSQLVNSLNARLDEVIAEVRAVAKNLVPQVLLEFGLSEAIEELGGLIKEASDLEVELIINRAVPNLTTEEELALYRIIQEFCNNTLKHSDAKHIQITYGKDGPNFDITLHDDGKGILESQFSNPRGLGIRNMQARARSIGATIELAKSNGGGTTIVVHVKSDE